MSVVGDGAAAGRPNFKYTFLIVLRGVPIGIAPRQRVFVYTAEFIQSHENTEKKQLYGS